MLRFLIAIVIVGAVLYTFDQAFHPTTGAASGGGAAPATPAGPAPSAPNATPPPSSGAAGGYQGIF